MPNYLKECHDKYLAYFSDNWMKDARTVISDSDEEVSKFSEIIDFETECFILLSKSILSGEYIEADSFISQIKLFIENSTVEKNKSEPNIIKKYYIVSDSLYNALNQYSAFILHAYEKFVTNRGERRINLYEQKNIPKDSVISYFDYTLKICDYDYKYPLLDEEFKAFLVVYLKIKYSLEKETNEQLQLIFQILLYKCNYIIKRINRKIDFSLLCDFYNISPVSLETNFLNKLILKQISFNHLNEDDIKNLKSNIKSDAPQLESFVRLSWHMAKNKNKSDIQEIIDLISNFENLFLNKISSLHAASSIKEQYDLFAINSVYNFLENCRLSLSLSISPFNFKELRNTIDRIASVQRGTYINNFHPYQKSIDSMLNFIENEIETNINSDIVTFERELFQLLDQYIAKYEKLIEWGESHRFFPFQLTFEESLIKYGDVELFIPSSFANIINYKDLKNKLVEYKSQRHILVNKYETYKSKLIINELKDRFKKDRFNMLQTMILFSGVITFLFGTINIFSNNSEMALPQLIINTIGLGIILILFTSVFMTIAPILSDIVDTDQIVKTRRFKWSAGFVLLYIILTIAIYFTVKDLGTSRNREEVDELIIKSPKNNVNLFENESTYILGEVI